MFTGPKKREATRPQLSHMPGKVEATRPSVSAGPKQRKAARCQTNRMSEQTINVVFTKSSTALQGDPAQPPPTFSFHRKRTTHPLSSAPNKKETPSQLRNATSQQSRKDQSKKPVPSLEPQSEASEHSQTLHLCNKLPASAEEEIPSCFQTFTLVQLTGIVNGSQENWRYKVQSGQSSTEETIKEKGLKFNVPFGHFIAKQNLQCSPN